MPITQCVALSGTGPLEVVEQTKHIKSWAQKQRKVLWVASEGHVAVTTVCVYWQQSWHLFINAAGMQADACKMHVNPWKYCTALLHMP